MSEYWDGFQKMIVVNSKKNVHTGIIIVTTLTMLYKVFTCFLYL